MVDGAFYRKRAEYLFGNKTAKERANELIDYCHRHLNQNEDKYHLLRIFYYDCLPIDKNVFHPFLRKQVNFSKTELYQWSHDFIDELKEKRKIAIRLGELAGEQACYTLKTDTVKKLFNTDNNFNMDNITEKDFQLQLSQKGVDMKIGIDIASLTYKKLVNQIILISEDSDFVPAAKLARK